MTTSLNLDQMTPEQLRALAEQAMQLLSQVGSMGQKIYRLQTVNEQLAHEIAILKRHKFAKRSEQLSPDQGSLLDDLPDTDIAAIEAELRVVNPPLAPTEPRQKPKRARCRCSFHARWSATSLGAPGAPAAANFSESARTSARTSITHLACSQSSNMCVESGPAAGA